MRVQGFQFRVQGLGFGAGFEVAGLRAYGSGCMAHGPIRVCGALICVSDSQKFEEGP